ncbi:pancreatic lipase-related protein 3-like [Diabrotica virgifera virgifera]|uniref:Pancreatic lipase-related protein 3-like n=1 Tax=Diabrotica virgifera virgifera TaxID=50390 RepID=A0A6P7F2D6_DIAVI|nr:pancreatic lipase-related protein 3-like [Diabrotica virgifera virgifera]
MKTLLARVLLYALIIISTSFGEETPLNPQRVDDATINSKLSLISEDDVKIYFRDQQKPQNDIPVSTSETSQLGSSGFSAERNTVVVIHGWKSSVKSEFNVVLSEAYLSKYNINLLVVDWSRVANDLYLIASASVEKIGQIVGNYIKTLQHKFQLDLNKTAIVGHSLGAHVAGIAGRTVGGEANYLIGLDPAWPLFVVLHRNIRIRPTDAKFVQVIHTSDVGIQGPLGHSDYYPNGGLRQPGCLPAAFDLCSHVRAYQLLAESIKTGRFIAKQCRNYLSFRFGCRGSQSYMGEFYIDKKARGTYFLDTNSKPPYAKD